MTAIELLARRIQSRIDWLRSTTKDDRDAVAELQAVLREVLALPNGTQA